MSKYLDQTGLSYFWQKVKALVSPEDIATAVSAYLDVHLTNPTNPPVDTSLAVSGAAADAKKTGDEINTLKEDISDMQDQIDEFSGGLTPAIKDALLNCFKHVGWDHEADATYYNALEEALYADEIKHISAVFIPGTHEIYPTDNIESLRNFLTVTATYQDDTQAVVLDYTLEGDISSTGERTITVKYGKKKTTTFTVTVVANTDGLLYEWDFTKGLTDLRQAMTAQLSCGDSSVIPYADANGLHFNHSAQLAVLLPVNEFPVIWFKDKTIQVDVASFVPGQQYDSTHTRFIMFANSNGVFDSGLVYRGNNTTGWSIYAGSNGWGVPFENLTRAGISGKKVNLYFDSELRGKLSVDGVSYGTQSKTLGSELKGLGIGSQAGEQYGATFFIALVTGIRIYSGEAA